MAKNQRMIGRQGEKRFSTLCSDADVTCNGSEEDDYGWDKLIQYPPRPQPLIAIDMRRGQISALVQVKTTISDNRTVSLKLDNALRYASSELPTFLVLVAIKDGQTRYFAKHVWAPQIGAWLQAAREADARGVTAIHKERLSVTFDQGDEHSTDLLDWMEREVEKIHLPYASSKKKIADLIGFGEIQGRGTVTLNLNGPQDYIDLQLGLKKSVSATRFVFHTERFGITSRQPEIDLTDVMLTLTPEGREGTLRLEFPNAKPLAVDAMIYTATAGNERAWRIATRCLDIIYDPQGRAQAHARLNNGEQATIDDLALFAKLQATKAGASIDLELELDRRRFNLGSIQMQGQYEKEAWDRLVLAIEVMREICLLAGCPVPDARFADLNKAIARLEVLGALASDRYLRLDVFPKTGVPKNFHTFLAYHSAQVGDHVFEAVARRPIISDLRKGRKRQIGFGSAQILYGAVSPAQDWSDGPLQAAYRRQLERLSTQGEILALGDLQAIVDGGPADQEIKIDLPESRELPRSE